MQLVVLGSGTSVPHPERAAAAHWLQTRGGSLLLLAVTALGLYYLGDEIQRHWVSVSHWSVGLGAAAVLLLHALIGRRG